MSDMVSYDITIALIEDLHAGSGLGGQGVDSLLARDAVGQPCLFWTHLKGVLRSVAAQKADELFGKTAEIQGKVVLTSAYTVSPIATRSISATARETHSRAPKTDTLRVYEYIPAGSVFVARAQVPQDLTAPFESALNACDCLGSSRHRGDGLVQITYSQTGSPSAFALTNPDSATARIRLLLTALDPISLPLSSELTGSIVRSASFVRGAALSGAFASLAIDAGQPANGQPMNGQTGIADAIWNQSMHIADALPLPHGIKNLQLSDITVLPMPATWRISKAQNLGDLPWWAKPAARELTDGAGRRTPDSALILCMPDQAYWYTPLMRSRPRIDVEKNGLYTQEEIVEGTEFVADLCLPTATLASFQALINQGRWLRIGHGGRPLKITNAIVLPTLEKQAKVGDCILLTSDWLVRNLHTQEFDPSLERYLASSADDAAFTASDIATSGVLIPGYSGRTRLPRLTKWAIARGGSFTLTAGEIAFPFGECAHEGFGQWQVLALKPDDVIAYQAPDSPLDTQDPRAEIVRVEAAAESLAERIKRAYGDADMPSRSLLYGLWTALAVAATAPADLIKYCESPKSRMSKLGKLNQLLSEELEDFAACRLALKLVIAQSTGASQ